MHRLSSQSYSSARFGILAPIIYFSTVIILGFLEPEYDHMTMMMSILGGVGGIRGFAFNLGIFLTGACVILFGFGLWQKIQSKTGAALFIVGGFALIGSAIFHCEANCTNVILERNFTGTLHMVFAFITGMCLSIAPFWIYAKFKGDDRWKRYRTFTLIVPILANMAGLFLWITLATRRVPAIEGLVQRLGIVFIFIWIGVISLRMYQLSMIDH
jgi:hypothetical membrane protein